MYDLLFADVSVEFNVLVCQVKILLLSPNSTSLGTSRHVTTRHVRRVEPVHFDCDEFVEQHG